MGEKRDHTAVKNDETPEPAAKRSKGSKSSANSKSRQHQNTHIDPTWGQKYVFSSIDVMTTVPEDPDVDFEDDGDAMAYLQSVRHEASLIPHLLVAPKIGPQLPSGFRNSTEEEEDEDEDGEPDRSIFTNGVGDFRGYYQDGAYTAIPDPWDLEEEDGEYWEGDEAEEPYEDADSEVAIDEAYFNSLAERFTSLREHLRSSPPEEAIIALPKTNSPYVGVFGPRSATFSIWSTRLRTTDPLPAQIAAMDKDAVLRVLRVLMGGKFLRRGLELRERTSRWLWALLARLPDVGDLSSMEIVWVRDLGKRAVLMMRSFAEMAALREELDGEGLGANEGVDDSEEDEEVVSDMKVEEADDDGSCAMEESPLPLTEGDTIKGESDDQNPLEDTSHPEDDMEEGEVDEGADDGEVDQGATTEASDLEDAKARLIAQLDAPPDPEPTDEDHNAPEEDKEERVMMNMRATLNMILTVAGEFYGQRDLLEFRDPFMVL